MTVLAIIDENSSQADGVIVDFNFDFLIFDESEIEVAVDGEVSELNVDYTVAINPVVEGGVVTFLVAPAEGSTVTRERNIPFTQNTDIPNVGIIREATIEQALDRSVMRDQHLLKRVLALENGDFTQGEPGPQGEQGEPGADGDRYATTSSTSLTLASSGSISLTIGTGLQYSVGQTVLIANDGTHYMQGTVTAYNSVTGLLTVTRTANVGAGTFTSWAVNLNGAPGPKGDKGDTGDTGAAGATGAAGPAGSSGAPIGSEMMWPTRTAPADWLLEYGQEVSRATYATLFALLCPANTVTVSIATPAIISAAGHGYAINDRIRFTTTGALPTGLAVGTDYFIISTAFTVNQFEVSTTRGGAAVNTSGSQSGVHTCRLNNYGLGDGVTTFNLPDMRGRKPLGVDNMGGVSANRVTDVEADAPGGVGGEETHVLTEAELAAHNHGLLIKNSAASAGASLNLTNCFARSSQSGGSIAFENGVPDTLLPDGSIADAGGGAAHNNMDPYMTRNFIIKVL